MGYTTDFEGEFVLDRPLDEEHRLYLDAFAETRRMKRDPAIAFALRDDKRVGVGLPIGPEGAYFVGGEGPYGQQKDASVTDSNSPPHGQPGLWCQWVPNADGSVIAWDGGEKFYDYEAWLQYLITHFLKPWGYTLNGSVTWQGESADDVGRIEVHANEIDVYEGEVTYRKRAVRS